MFPGRSRVGLEAEARLVVPDGFVEFPLQAETDREVAMRVGVPRIDLDHLAQMRDRFIELVARTEQHGEIEVRVGVVRIEPHGARNSAIGVVGSSWPAAGSRRLNRTRSSSGLRRTARAKMR